MRRPRGFTLMELMSTIVIAGILLAIGLPGMSRYSLKSARSKGATELYGALTLARSEAVARNAPVTVCRRDYYSTAAWPRCAVSSGAWAQGWIVFQDSTGSFGGSTEPNAAVDVIAVYDPVGQVSPSNSDNAFNIVTSMTFPTHLVFQANGRAGEAATFTVCDTKKRLQDARRVDVALSGRVSLVELSAAEAAAGCS